MKRKLLYKIKFIVIRKKANYLMIYYENYSNSMIFLNNIDFSVIIRRILITCVEIVKVSQYVEGTYAR